MKIVQFLIVFFVFCLTSLSAAPPRAFKLSYETICCTTVCEEEKYQILDTADAGCHKTLMRLHDYPYGKEFFLFYKRPLIKEGRVSVRRVMLSKMREVGEKLDEKTPMITLSSRSVFPGERVSYQLETLDHYVKSSEVEMIPHPLLVRSIDGVASMSAELISLQPTIYKIYLRGLKKNEKFDYLAKSAGNKFHTNSVYTRMLIVLYNPCVDLVNGGTAVVTITRESGEKLSLPFIWGDELVPHLKGENTVVNTNFQVIRSEVF